MADILSAQLMADDFLCGHPSPLPRSHLSYGHFLQLQSIIITEQ